MKCVLTFLSLVLFSLGGCSTLTMTRHSDLELQQEVTVTESGHTGTNRKKGEILTVHENPVFIEAEGYIPVMLVPLGTTGAGKLSLKPVDKVEGGALHHRESIIFSNILSGVNDVQIKLASRKPYAALSAIEDLRNKYPDIVALKFLKASCLMSVGRQREAKALLEEGLKEAPTDKFARKMLNALNGVKSAEPSKDEPDPGEPEHE